ncbi:MAG: hypothetical protein QF885_03855 [Candidatus Thalassarchaeaceae archaeon]|nr:hypothetical protein [Candidatus Thalassarchaeaceae archaeon]MDP6742253.1 hypothetical protein [Candidatus Thalassarchaeaceae archaeon]MDP7042929.1 hypothetical protein [Candidatus Thalassarchaeaceae archaeon]
MTELPEMTQGNSEPASSTAVWTMSIVGVLAFIILYGVLYPEHPFPGLGDILPLFSALGNSLVWFFIAGVLLGLGTLVAMLVGESIAE